MAKAKGSPKTGGRVAGTPNKFTKTLKEMILGALEDMGGQEYLKSQARMNPAPYLSLLGKTLPTTLEGNKDNPVHVHTTSQGDQDLIQRYLASQEKK